MKHPEIGSAFVFGDGIDTDLLAPGHLMKLTAEALATHCLEAIDPAFAGSVRRGDVLVAGENFGLGSSREQAAESLKVLGVSCVLAKSFARIFYRNAFNLGLPAIIFPQADTVSRGDRIRVDALAGTVENLSRGETFRVAPLPAHLAAMLQAGGMIPYLKQRLSPEKPSP